jgi:hypothetical protein
VAPPSAWRPGKLQGFISILLMLFVIPQVLWLAIKDAPAAGNASLDKSRHDA